jgi:hypothetical protein
VSSFFSLFCAKARKNAKSLSEEAEFLPVQSGNHNVVGEWYTPIPMPGVVLKETNSNCNRLSVIRV